MSVKRFVACFLCCAALCSIFPVASATGPDQSVGEFDIPVFDQPQTPVLDTSDPDFVSKRDQLVEAEKNKGESVNDPLPLVPSPPPTSEGDSAEVPSDALSNSDMGSTDNTLSTEVPPTVLVPNVQTDLPVSDVPSAPVVTAINPVKPNDATGLKKALLEVLGNYDAVVVTYNDSHERYNTVQPDYPWLCGAGILALFILCLFKLLGVILCKR